LTPLLSATVLAGAASAGEPKQAGRGDAVVHVTVAAEMKLIVAKGQGLSFGEALFRRQELIGLTVAQARAGKEVKGKD
jgi:hypothetical protein